MFAPKSLLIATDFSESSETAAVAARSLAQRWGSTVHVVFVIEQVTGYTNIRIHHHESPPYLEMMVQEGREALDAFVSRHFGDLPAPQRHLRVGRPTDEILRAASDGHAELIVVGTRAESGLDRFVRGSVAENVITRSPLPVLSIQGPLALNAQVPVLVAVDFSPASEMALQVAEGVALAQSPGEQGTAGHVPGSPAPLALLSVLEPPNALALWTLTPAEPQAKAEARVLEQMIQFAEKRLQPGTPFTVKVTTGRLEEEVKKAVQDSKAAMVVMGTRGQSGLAEWFLGSGAQRVLRGCPSPLLTVRG